MNFTDLKVIFCTALILLAANTLSGQVNFTANDLINPYEGYYHPGINLGYYGPQWDDNELADLSAGNGTVGLSGIGVKALRGSLPEGLGRTFTYDIWINKYNYNNAVGTTDNLLFLGFASEEHRDPVDYCPNDDFQTDMFANLYEPIWDDGQNGTPVNDDNYYALYVYEVVSRLKDKVKFWEIWNEPGFDFTGAKGFLPPGVPGNWWENNPDPCDYKLRAPIFHYIRTLRISYEVIKTIAPDDYVCVAGVGFDSFLDAILRNTDNPDDGKVTPEYPLGGGAYFDVIGFHAYPHIDGTTRYWDVNLGGFVFERHSDAAADGLKTRTDARQEVLERYGYDGVTYPKKEWIATEVNVPSRPFSQEWGSEEVQRNYVMKVNIEAMELDYTQLHLFVLADFKNDDEAGFEFDQMGMYGSISDKVPYEQELKESGIGLKTMSDALFETRYDAAKTAEMNLGDNIDGGAFRHADGTYTYALWAKTETDLSEEAFAVYSFPNSFGISNLIRREWDFSKTNDRIVEVGTEIALTAAPIFLRKTEEDPDISLDVICDMGVEIQVTATSPEGGQFVSWPEPRAESNCPGGVTIEQTQGPANGGFFPFGAHEIQYTISNECGDVRYCAFNVKVASTGGGIGDCNLFRWELGFVGQFQGNKYFVSKVKKDYASAQAQCESHGGYLVSIDSPEENEFLRQQVNDLGFIGYNDINQEGELEWTSGKEVVYTNIANCQGCTNSEAADATLFNHFNGEWFFVLASSEEFFIMELPCAEVPPCVCTTEYNPVCTPDGTEYSNACFAECAGFTNFITCNSECDFEGSQTVQDLIDIFDCENQDGFLATIAVNDNSFLIVDDGSSVATDGGYFVLDCEEQAICSESGFGSPLCTDIFGPDFLLESDTIYLASEDCQDPCVLEDQIWFQELLADTTLCENTCYTSIETFDFGDSSYVAFIGHLGPCPDFQTEVYNCEGVVICAEGGFAGLTECSTLFGNDFPFLDNNEIIWSPEDCVSSCVLDDQVWLDNLLDTLNCADCIDEVVSFNFDNTTYVATVADDEDCGPSTVRLFDCVGTLICIEGGEDELTQCSAIFGEDFDPERVTIWSREVECLDCDFENLDWLEAKIDSLDCNSCYNEIRTVYIDNQEYIIVYGDGSYNAIECFGEPSILIYDCEGIILCEDIDDTSFYPCETFIQSITAFGEILWSQEEECEDCVLSEQDWLNDLLDSNTLCEDCISSIERYTFSDNEYLVTFGDTVNCSNPETIIYTCSGQESCRLITGSNQGQCNGFLFRAEQDSILWQRDVECLDNAVQNLHLDNLSLFPNPADESVQITFGATSSMDIDYSILNITGQIMMRGQQLAQVGQNEIVLDVEQLVSGIYLIRMVDIESGAERSMKLVLK